MAPMGMGDGGDGFTSRARACPSRRRAAMLVPALAGGLLAPLAALPPALAGTFEVNWGTAPFIWPAGDPGPRTYTMRDARGFELDVTIDTAQIGGTYFPGSPTVTTVFGTQPSLLIAHDAANQNGAIGEATMTATMQLSSGGAPFAADGIAFRVADIDSVDQNQTSDRCDHVTLTGDNGDPTLDYVLPQTAQNVADRTANIGTAAPNEGTGGSPDLAPNQAQCRYILGSGGSAPSSNNDDNGTVLASYPPGTSLASIEFDESIENVWTGTLQNPNIFDPAARGIGVFSAVAVTVNDADAIALTKDADRAFYAAGETITYTYVVTNNGDLPINTGQDIVIEDDVLGTVSCPAIAADIPPGGTHTCTATYAVDAVDMTAASIDNTAIAGVGTPDQAFAARLQSNDASESVTRAVPSASVDKTRATGPDPVTAAGQTIGYTIVAGNTGNVPLTAPALTDTLPDGSAGVPTFVGGDADGDGAIDVGETWTYSIDYTVTQADIDAGVPLVNAASLDADELASPVTDDESVGVTATPTILIAKAVDDAVAVAAGQTLTYTYDVTNTGNQTLSAVTVSDVHDGRGAAPVPGFEQLLTDAGPAGDSTDAAVDGTWDTLAPGDTVRFQATYTVVQRDVDELQ